MLMGGGVFDYDCDWKIVQLEDQQTLQTLWNYYKSPIQDEATDSMRAMTHHQFKTIYIMKGVGGEWTMLGCTILWHEILHAMGFMHEEMSLCKYKPRQVDPNSWTVFIP